MDPPFTPPILEALVRAHSAFIERNRIVGGLPAACWECEFTRWIIQEAAEVDRRAAAERERREFLVWCAEVAAEIDIRILGVPDTAVTHDPDDWD